MRLRDKIHTSLEYEAGITLYPISDFVASVWRAVYPPALTFAIFSISTNTLLTSIITAVVGSFTLGGLVAGLVKGFITEPEDMLSTRARLLRFIGSVLVGVGLFYAADRGMDTACYYYWGQLNYRGRCAAFYEVEKMAPKDDKARDLLKRYPKRRIGILSRLKSDMAAAFYRR